MSDMLKRKGRRLKKQKLEVLQRKVIVKKVLKHKILQNQLKKEPRKIQKILGITKTRIAARNLVSSQMKTVRLTEKL